MHAAVLKQLLSGTGRFARNARASKRMWHYQLRTKSPSTVQPIALERVKATISGASAEFLCKAGIAVNNVPTGSGELARPPAFVRPPPF